MGGGLRNNLEGWDGKGGEEGFQEEGTYVYYGWFMFDVWQKPTQYYKAIIILQLKIIFLKEREQKIKK